MGKMLPHSSTFYWKNVLWDSFARDNPPIVRLCVKMTHKRFPMGRLGHSVHDKIFLKTVWKDSCEICINSIKLYYKTTNDIVNTVFPRSNLFNL